MSTAKKNESKPVYTLEDYQQWEGDWELLHGVPYRMGPSPFLNHGEALLSIGTAFKLALYAAKCGATAVAEVDWIVSKNTVVRPDIMIVCQKSSSSHLESPPALVLEILSASTRTRDLSAKRSLYESQGVPYYLLVDCTDQSVVVLQLDAEGRYQQQPVESPLEISICDDCELSVDVGLFWGGHA